MEGEKMRTVYDILIVGSGASGLYAALSAEPSVKVLLLSKDALELSNSALAQGGVASVQDQAHDSFEIHFEDTMAAGGRTNDPDAVNVLVHEGPRDVLNLAQLGVDFDRDASGALDLTLEGGHTRRRIAHYRDTTGFEIVQKLLAQAKERENIEILDRAALLRLEKAENGFRAGILRGGDYATAAARCCILATGGIGRVYRYTTNSRIATGDGIYFAARLGARIRDLSLIQFHPTAFAAPGQDDERFLISESVRGEGARLLNADGRRFMTDYDPRGELAPRDVVSKCILREQNKTGSDAFYLDITHEDSVFVKARFPAIYKKCLEYGIDMTRQRIPVYPCQHYLMGGIDVDTCARTAVDGLYAVGECSHTGVHGNNRLASNSLLEALVFSRRAVRDIEDKLAGPAPAAAPFSLRPGEPAPDALREEIRSIMQKSYFVNPDLDEAARNLPRVAQIAAELDNGRYAETPALLEAKSLANAAQIILREVCAK